MSIIEELKVQIKALELQINDIQDACSHPKEAVAYKHEANTGNWDPNDDCYWTVLHCELCDKRWTEDGSVGRQYGSKEIK